MGRLFRQPKIHHLMFTHKLSKHDHGSAEVETSSYNDKLTYLSTNSNFAPSKIERVLIINKSLDLSFSPYFISRRNI